MGNESPEDRRMKELWQSQQTEGFRMSIEKIRASSRKFQRKIQWRNGGEYAAALVVIVLFGFQFAHTGDILARTGFAVIVASMIYVVWNLHSRGSAKAFPNDAGIASCLEFQRRELERQRDLVSSVWRWYLGPMIPGLAILIVAFGRANPQHLKYPGVLVAIYAAVIGIVFWGIGKLNSAAAERLQKQIDELNNLQLDERGRPL
jgi:hypothetical protein